MKKILFTAHQDTLPEFLSAGTTLRESILHLPLETYHYDVDDEMHNEVERELDKFAYVIHGSRLHARYFIRWMREYGQSDRVQQLVHLVMDQPTADILEEYQIPAIKPRDDARPIDLIEFLLRISYEGNILYPSGDQKTDEIPGLLIELELPFAEFQVFSEESLDRKKLDDYRKQVSSNEIAGVIFHNESSITRVKTAFPDLDLTKTSIISAGGRVTRKLTQMGYKNITDGKGSWKKIQELALKLAKSF
ncbi:MAG: uroporphyrinogen-III synthase [Balneolaceae bacterium]|nr:uroporphyrinogen-III synthase [Balneolaceae bacterium]